MYNLNKEKLIILTLAAPLCVLSLFLVLLGEGIFALGASQGSSYKSETIYEKRECADCNCKDCGKKLISFKGTDSGCEGYASEDDRTKCYFNNSQASFACPDLEDSGEVDNCFERYRGPVFNYYQGGAGTLVANQSFTTGGSRMYFTGFDADGQHVIKTGADEPSNNALTLRESCRDVQYGGDLDVNGNVTVKSVEGGAYFGSDVEYGEVELNEDGLRGQGVVKHDNFNGFNLNQCMDMKVLANHNHIMTVPGGDRQNNVFGSIEIEKGLEINGDLKASFMFFQGRWLVWSPPKRGHFILYYNTPSQDPTACELPGYPRDEPPVKTPDLAGVGESGPGGGSSGGGGGGSGGGGGFLWKPKSENTGNLVILLPSSYSSSCKVTANGTSIPYSGRANGNRPHYRSSQPGSSFSAPASVVATCPSGENGNWTINNPSERYE